MYQVKIEGMARPFRRIEEFPEALAAATEFAGQLAAADIDNTTPIKVLVTAEHKYRGEIVHASVRIDINQEER